MNRPTLNDTIATGLLLGPGSIVATTLLLTLALALLQLPIADHTRWYAAAFIPPILLLRLTLKRQLPTAAKTIIVTLILTFLPFIAYLLRTNTLTIQ